MKSWIKPIKELSACTDALKWAEDYGTLEEAWAKCERGDWMLWLLGKLSGVPESDSRKKLVLTACQCARLALPYVKAGELRPLKAIETAEAWARGEDGITLQDVKAADAAAYDAAYADAAAAYAAAAYDAAYAAAYTAADADAAYAAAYAAYTAADAAYTAYAAADAAYAADAAAYAAAYAAYDAAYAAAYAAADAAADAARFSTLKKCADIVRGYYPNAPEI